VYSPKVAINNCFFSWLSAVRYAGASDLEPYLIVLTSCSTDAGGAWGLMKCRCEQTNCECSQEIGSFIF